jgi:hypothetical protein
MRLSLVYKEVSEEFLNGISHVVILVDLSSTSSHLRALLFMWHSKLWFALAILLFGSTKLSRVGV